MKKRIFTIIGLSIILGLVLLIIQLGFNIEFETLMSYYWKIALLFLLLILIFNFIYMMYYADKIKKALVLLNEGKNQEYIAEMETILQKIKVKEYRDLIKINLSAGYINNKEYEKSLNILNSVAEKQIRNEQLKLVYWINKAISYFRIGDFDSCKEIYNQQKVFFEKYQDDDNYGESIGQIEVLHALVEEDLIKAEQLLQNLKAKWNTATQQKNYDELERIIETKKNSPSV